MINFIKEIFNNRKSESTNENQNNNIDEILIHNQNTINPNKLNYLEELKKSEEKYRKRYEEQVNKKEEKDLEKKEKVERKKAFEENRKKRQKEFHKNNKKKGTDFELKTGKVYEERGYKVLYNGIENDKKDKGIDLICVNSEEIILIQCKNYSKEKSIDHVKVKEFHSNAIIYIEKYTINKEQVKLKYVVPDKKVFDNSAIRVFRDDTYNCRYEVI